MCNRFVTLLTLLSLLAVAGTLAAQEPRPPLQRPRATLGIMVDPRSREADRSGVIVREVANDSPAAKAGLKSGDTITRIDDKDIRDFEGMLSILAKHKPGDKLPFHVLRDGKEQTLTVTLGERAVGRGGLEPPRGRPAAFLGVHTQPLNAESREQLGVTAQEGVLAAEVLPDSPAAQGKLQRGDVITSFDGKPVSHPGELREAVLAAGPGKDVRLAIMREKEKKELTVKLQEAPVDGFSMVPFPIPAPGATGGRVLTPAILGSADRVADLEKRLHDLEKRVCDLEGKKPPQE